METRAHLRRTQVRVAVGLFVVALVVTFLAFASRAFGESSIPKLSINQPTSSNIFNAGTWQQACHPAGICGSATAASSLTALQVSIQNSATRRYFDGHAFVAAKVRSISVRPGSTWSLVIPKRPADGTYLVVATGRYSNPGGFSSTVQSSTSFVIDSIAPGVPVILEAPKRETTRRSADFGIKLGSRSAVTFSCGLDGASLTPCTGDPDHDAGPVQAEVEYDGLEIGSHCFAVAATDLAGNVSKQASYCWLITPARLVARSGGVTELSSGAPKRRPFSIRLVDAHGVGLSNQPVTFLAPAIGPGGVFSPCAITTAIDGQSCTVRTDAYGVAITAPFTPNANSGPFVVSVTSPLAPTAIDLSAYTSVAFKIDVQAVGTLRPGVTVPLDLTVTNPNTLPISVIGNSLNVSILSNSQCAATNFAVSSTLGTNIVVPGGATIHLSASSSHISRWPKISMRNTAFNQDGCRNQTLSLVVSARARG